MSNYFKFLGIIILVFFGFFYTERVINVIKEEDELMIKIKEEKKNYDVLPENATLNGNLIFPGINGREVDINRSYKELNKIGIFNDKFLIFNDVTPSISIYNNKDKFIGGGNKKFNNVALLFKITNKTDTRSLFAILNKKNIKINFFVSYDYLYDNIDSLFNNENYEFYSYGKDGEYKDDTLIMSNNIINRKNNVADKCLSESLNNKIIDVCSSNSLFTIYPSIINASYSDVKSYIENGSIVSFENNNKYNELNTIIDYINSKGYKISFLSEIINEEYK